MTTATLLALSPCGWDELWPLIEDIPGRQRWAHQASAQTAGSILSLAFPHWANELAGGRLTRQRCMELQRVQGFVLSLVQAHDVLIDGEEPPEDAAAHLLPLGLEVQRELARFFPMAHDFWDQYARLLREQAESARWEQRARKRPERKLDAPLVERLGRKGALLRWPAFAVCALSGVPQRAALVERQLGRLLSVLQLLDDTLDYAEDAASGQPNGVLAALGGAPKPAWALHARAPAGIAAARDAASYVLALIRAEAGDALAPLLAHLKARLARAARVASAQARARAAQAMLAELI